VKTTGFSDEERDTWRLWQEDREDSKLEWTEMWRWADDDELESLYERQLREDVDNDE
jgi:hypothetical protein